MRECLHILSQSLRNSYSAMVFSRDSWIGVALFFVTLLYPLSALCGFFCVLLVNGLALALSLDRFKLTHGIYGYNAIILGVALGALYPPNLTLFTLLVAASLLLLLMTAALEALLAKAHLPYLVFPFLITLWFVLLLTQQKDGEFYIDCVLGDHFGMLGWGDYSLSAISDHPVWLLLPNAISEFFVSLSSILFRQDIFLGFVVAVLLLCYSRIAFLFVLTNHLLAYFLYQTMGGELFHIPYACFGFNFVLTALALSCYLVPSKSALFCSLLLIPVQFLAVYASTRLLSYLYLPSFSFAFCVVTLLCLVLLRRRSGAQFPRFSYFLERTPEENLYNNQTNAQRYRWCDYHPFALPFFGEWRVSQGVDGAYTHQGLWKDALDFVVEVEGSQFKGTGNRVTDYYCYGKPVLAPADGTVVCVENEVADNVVGESNQTQNWGNYVIIKHWEGFYSLLAHLKCDTFTCAVGDTVKRGQELALCGNSGLSPYPHLHFQFQSAPYAGAPTLSYPFLHYLASQGEEMSLVSCQVPREGDRLRNLSESGWNRPYQFYVGERVTVTSESYGTEQWSVCEAYGYTYLWEETRGAKAWFSNHNQIFEFQRFEGDTKGALFQFFLSNHKILSQDTERWSLEEEIPLSVRLAGWKGYLVDGIAPFVSVMRNEYRSNRLGEDRMDSSVTVVMGGKDKLYRNYRTTIIGTTTLEVKDNLGMTMRIEHC